MKLAGPRWPALVLLSAALLAGAQSTSERLEQLQRDLQGQRELGTAQRQELERLRRNIATLSAQGRETLAQLDALAADVAGLENETATLGARVALAQRQLADTTSQGAVTQARVTRLQGDVRELLDALYRERSGRYLQLLSQSRSLSDLLIRLKYANIAGQYNVEVTRTLRREVQTLEAQRTQQAQQTASLQALQAQRVTALEALRDRRAEQTRLLASLRRSEQGQRTLAARTQAEQALTARTIDDLVGAVVKERARLEAERLRRLEEERKRREAELRRIREAQERARQEALRLARVRAEQERQAQLARERAEAQARARAAAEARARAQAAAQAQARVQAAQARAQAEAQARARAQAEAQAARDRAAREAALATQRQRQTQLQQEQAALQARETQVQEAAAQAVQELAPLPPISGPVGFPLPGGSVSQPYGSNGAQWSVLQSAEGGQAVAALDGNVMTTTYYASLGWVVLLDHGPLVTAYFGLLDTQVETGARVSRGTPLGTVGGSPIFGPGRMAFQVNSVSGGGRRPVPPPF
jgi:septal ring factor EnvC (AmiA/AmiB activator)